MSADPKPRNAPRIAVLIPYFQRQAGLLNRSLSSVAGQRHRPAQVIVVDDGSPRPAADEITPALHHALPGLTVVRQLNQGIARARNAGLDALSADISAVALLDSDDYWEGSHLEKAATALSLGADFFFSNSRIEGEAGDRFRECPRLLSAQPLAEAPGVFRWRDSVPALMGAACPFATSTVVFRRAVMPELRFSTRFRRAGEDQSAFWALLVRSSVIVYSTEPTLIYGADGVGTWQHSTFGSVAHLVRLADEIRLRRHVMSSYPVSADDRRLMRRAIAARRYAALYSALHLLRRRRENAFREILYVLRSDPACTASWCVDLPRLLYRRLRKAPVMTEWAG
jgi:succinoglycan biosynthesis protein ExoW